MLPPAAAAPRTAGPGGPGEARPGAPLPRAGEAKTCWVIVINYSDRECYGNYYMMEPVL